MDEGLATLRKAPFQHKVGRRLRRLIRKVASAVVKALEEEHPHAFRCARPGQGAARSSSTASTPNQGACNCAI